MSDWRLLQRKIVEHERKEQEYLDLAELHRKCALRYTEMLELERVKVKK